MVLGHLKRPGRSSLLPCPQPWPEFLLCSRVGMWCALSPFRRKASAASHLVNADVRGQGKKAGPASVEVTVE